MNYFENSLKRILRASFFFVFTDRWADAEVDIDPLGLVIQFYTQIKGMLFYVKLVISLMKFDNFYFSKQVIFLTYINMKMNNFLTQLFESGRYDFRI